MSNRDRVVKRAKAEGKVWLVAAALVILWLIFG